MNQQTMTMAAVSVLLASLALAGCNKRDDASAPRGNDNTAVVTGQPTMGEQATKAAEDAKNATKEAANDVKDATKSAADLASNKVSDALITTSVKAELAKDPKLSALAISVDTDGGRVALKGTAPDADSKDRATKLASGVKGVTSVDNQLSIKS